jgi:2-polyprenyl-3-methyl-5-hydroxy-6-metoxy-1,4-benzoquinol methylase
VQKNLKILDIGCGTGLLGIASDPYVNDGGEYIGIDVMKKDIEFCRMQYDSPWFNFIHHDVFNPSYANDQSKSKIP